MCPKPTRHGLLLPQRNPWAPVAGLRHLLQMLGMLRVSGQHQGVCLMVRTGQGKSFQVRDGCLIWLNYTEALDTH